MLNPNRRMNPLARVALVLLLLAAMLLTTAFLCDLPDCDSYSCQGGGAGCNPCIGTRR